MLTEIRRATSVITKAIICAMTTTLITMGPLQKFGRKPAASPSGAAAG
ncbi:MAG: hypothetical protein P8Z42_14055 [Anaerolineales bacterium]